MKEKPITIQRACEVLQLPYDKGARILRELGVKIGGEDSQLTAMHIVILGLHTLCTRTAQTDDMGAFALCRQVYRLDTPILGQLGRVRDAIASEENDPQLSALLVTLHDGRYAACPYSDTLYDINTGEQLDALPQPACYCVAIDLTAVLVRFFKQNSRQF